MKCKLCIRRIQHKGVLVTSVLASSSHPKNNNQTWIDKEKLYCLARLAFGRIKNISLKVTTTYSKWVHQVTFKWASAPQFR